MFYVYILKGSEKLYCGYTADLERRYTEHNSGNGGQTTSRMGSLELVGYFEFQTKKEALSFETKIKKSGHIARYLEHPDIKNQMG